MFTQSFPGNVATLLKLTPSASGYTRSTIPQSVSTSDTVPNIAVNSAGDVYIVDVGPSSTRIVKETKTGGSYSQSVPVTGLGTKVYGIAVDTAGNIYLTNASTVIKETLSSGGYTATTVVTGLGSGDNLAVDAAGNLYVAEASGTVVYKETRTGGAYLQTVAVGGISAPGGVAVDSSGNLYVTELGSENVYKESLGAINFGQENVGSTEAPVCFKFLFDTGGTIGVPKAVTQGGLTPDFSVANSSTCSSNEPVIRTARGHLHHQRSVQPPASWPAPRSSQPDEQLGSRPGH